MQSQVFSKSSFNNTSFSKPNEQLMLVATVQELTNAGLDFSRITAANSPLTDSLFELVTNAIKKGVLRPGKHKLHKFQVVELAKPDRARAGAVAAQAPHDDYALLTADEMASRMSCTPPTVYERESSDDFFAVIPPGRVRGRKYPAFQLNHKVDRSLLKDVIQLYKKRGASLNNLWTFLRTSQGPLGGSSFLNVLVGDSPAALQKAGPVARKRFLMNMVLEDLARTTS